MKYDKLDKPRDFTLDLKATAMAEAVLGYGLHQVLTTQGGPRAYLTLLWAGLARRDSSLELDHVFKLSQKAVTLKRTTMEEIQRFVLQQLRESTALTGYQFEYEDDEPDGLAAAGGASDVSPLHS